MSTITDTRRQANDGQPTGPEGISPQDEIFLLVGAVGAGKTNFIHKITGEGAIGDGLSAETANLRHFAIRHHPNHRPVVLVDTPGFDNASRPDADVFGTIVDWLKEIQGRGIKLAGVIFLHRISDNRVNRPTLSNVQVFGRLCGAEAMKGVVIVTTMWDIVPREVAAGRENQLRSEFFAELLQGGCRTMPFHNTTESAWEIIDSIDSGRFELGILSEMKDGKNFGETLVGKGLNRRRRSPLIWRLKNLFGAIFS